MKSPERCKSIDEVREAIDLLDKKIIKLFGKRSKYVKKIVKFKNKDKDSIIAKERYDNVIASRREIAQSFGLNPDIIEAVYRKLLDYFIEEEFNELKKDNL